MAAPVSASLPMNAAASNGLEFKYEENTLYIGHKDHSVVHLIKICESNYDTYLWTRDEGLLWGRFITVSKNPQTSHTLSDGSRQIEVITSKGLEFEVRKSEKDVHPD